MIDFISARERIKQRLQPIRDKGVQVDFVPRQRNLLGNTAPNSASLFWGAITSDPTRTSGNMQQVRLYQIGINCRCTTSQGNGGLEDVLQDLDQLLHGWECPGFGRLEFAAYEYQEQEQGDPSYRFSVQFTCLVQEGKRR